MRRQIVTRMYKSGPLRYSYSKLKEEYSVVNAPFCLFYLFSVYILFYATICVTLSNFLECRNAH